MIIKTFIDRPKAQILGAHGLMEFANLDLEKYWTRIGPELEQLLDLRTMDLRHSKNFYVDLPHIDKLNEDLFGWEKPELRARSLGSRPFGAFPGRREDLQKIQDWLIRGLTNATDIDSDFPQGTIHPTSTVSKVDYTFVVFNGRILTRESWGTPLGLVMKHFAEVFSQFPVAGIRQCSIEGCKNFFIPAREDSRICRLKKCRSKANSKKITEERKTLSKTELKALRDYNLELEIDRAAGKSRGKRGRKPGSKIDPVTGKVIPPKKAKMKRGKK